MLLPFILTAKSGVSYSQRRPEEEYLAGANCLRRCSGAARALITDALPQRLGQEQGCCEKFSGTSGALDERILKRGGRVIVRARDVGLLGRRSLGRGVSEARGVRSTGCHGRPRCFWS